MPEKKTVFITGATGLLGSYLLKILLENGYKVYALARNKGNKTAKDRVLDVLRFWDDKILNENLSKLAVLTGDITHENLGLDNRTISLLKNEIDEIFHCAAITEFNAALAELRRVNVQGTKNLLDFFGKTYSSKILKGINYISTAFVCGTFDGSFAEKDFNLNQRFNNNYEQSKFEAENIARQYLKSGLPIRIFRPPILIGEYFSGKTTEFKMFYEPLRLFSLEIFEEVPLDTRTFLNLMPVDLVAKAIYILSIHEDIGKVYHITSPNAFAIDHIVSQSSIFFNFIKPRYIELQKYKAKNVSPTAKKILETYIPYFNFIALFDCSMTQKILKKYNFEYPPIDDDFLQRIFTFCNHKRFIRIKK